MAQTLAQLTTIGVGGKPERLRVAANRAQLVAEALEMWADSDDWLVVGGGSNLVVADEIGSLQVLQVATRGVESVVTESGSIRLRVEAGEVWDDLVSGTVAAGLAGLEALSGIPGSVGAAPIQNIGAYGTEVSSVIRRVGFLDFNTGDELELTAEQLGFAYRDSIFKQGKLGVVLWVEFELQQLGGLSLPIRFQQLAKALGVDEGASVPVAQVRTAVLNLRKSKGMVLDPTDSDTASCGSFFINPVVSARHARTLPADAPRFEIPGTDGEQVKLSAAWLIEHSGIPKGFSLGDSRASVSSKHTLAIVNRGGATSEEVVQLAQFIQIRVSNQFGVTLLPEANLVGF